MRTIGSWRGKPLAQPGAGRRVAEGRVERPVIHPRELGLAPAEGPGEAVVFARQRGVEEGRVVGRDGDPAAGVGKPGDGVGRPVGVEPEGDVRAGADFERHPLLGEVADEHDRTRAGVIRGRDSITFPGILRPAELEERAGVTVPKEGPYETVAGFVMNELGRLPKVGDEVAIEGGTLRVERLDGRRVDRIRYTPDPVAVTADREEAAHE